MSNGNLWLLSTFFALHCFFYYTWVGWAPTLIMLKGGTPELAGITSSLALWAAIPAVFIVPKIAHRLGTKKPYLWGSAIAMVVAACIVTNIPLSMSWLPMVLVGIADCVILIFRCSRGSGNSVRGRLSEFDCDAVIGGTADFPIPKSGLTIETLQR